MKKMVNLSPKYCLFIATYLLLIICISCDSEVPAHTEDVTITIDVKEVSAGYAQVRFSTDKEAFYLISIQPVRENINPQEKAKIFMLLSLDSAYVEYLYWRNQQLQQSVPFVADFASHSLQYGSIEHFFTLLEPSKDYWIYAFVVDPTTNKPAGKLFVETITTDSVSTRPIFFDYRVEGNWDYVYPKDSLGEIQSKIPWVYEVVDSLTIRENGVQSPGEYFFNRFESIYKQEYDRILYGIYAHENISDEDTSTTKFEIGKTYYAAMASLDAPLVYPLPSSVYDIYRFTWMGDTTNFYFTSVQSIDGEW